MIDPADDDRSVEELARAARAGSSASFGALVRRYQRPLYRFLLLRTGDQADAEEATQDAFVRAWQHLDSYDPQRPFATWLFTIAARQAVSLHRQRRRQASEPIPGDMDSGELGPHQTSVRRELRDNLWDLAARVLSRDQLSALWLRYAEDMAPREIGRILGRCPSSTRVVLFRARQLLGRHLPDPAPADASATVTDPTAVPALSPLHLTRGA